MNRPTLLTRLLGNLSVYLLLLAAAIGMIYSWWTQPDRVSAWVPILALFIGSIATNAHARVDRYKQWKRAWDAVETPPTRKRHHGLNALYLLLVTAGLAYWLALHPPSSPMAIEEQAAVCGFILVFLAFLYQFAQWQRHRPATSAKPKAEHIVSLSMSVPKKCDPLPHMSKLPAHCQMLLTPQVSGVTELQ